MNYVQKDSNQRRRVLDTCIDWLNPWEFPLDQLLSDSATWSLLTIDIPWSSSFPQITKTLAKYITHSASSSSKLTHAALFILDGAFRHWLNDRVLMASTPEEQHHSVRLYIQMLDQVHAYSQSTASDLALQHLHILCCSHANSSRSEIPHSIFNALASHTQFSTTLNQSSTLLLKLLAYSNVFPVSSSNETTTSAADDINNDPIITNFANLVSLPSINHAILFQLCLHLHATTHPTLLPTLRSWTSRMIQTSQESASLIGICLTYLLDSTTRKPTNTSTSSTSTSNNIPSKQSTSNTTERHSSWLARVLNALTRNRDVQFVRYIKDLCKRHDAQHVLPKSVELGGFGEVTLRKSVGNNHAGAGGTGGRKSIGDPALKAVLQFEAGVDINAVVGDALFICKEFELTQRIPGLLKRYIFHKDTRVYASVVLPIISEHSPSLYKVLRDTGRVPLDQLTDKGDIFRDIPNINLLLMELQTLEHLNILYAPDGDILLRNQISSKSMVAMLNLLDILIMNKIKQASDNFALHHFEIITRWLEALLSTSPNLALLIFCAIHLKLFDQPLSNLTVTVCLAALISLPNSKIKCSSTPSEDLLPEQIILLRAHNEAKLGFPSLLHSLLDSAKILSSIIRPSFHNDLQKRLQVFLANGLAAKTAAESAQLQLFANPISLTNLTSWLTQYIMAVSTSPASTVKPQLQLLFDTSTTNSDPLTVLLLISETLVGIAHVAGIGNKQVQETSQRLLHEACTLFHQSNARKQQPSHSHCNWIPLLLLSLPQFQLPSMFALFHPTAYWLWAGGSDSITLPDETFAQISMFIENYIMRLDPVFQHEFILFIKHSLNQLYTHGKDLLDFDRLSLIIRMVSPQCYSLLFLANVS